MPACSAKIRHGLHAYPHHDQIRREILAVAQRHSIVTDANGPGTKTECDPMLFVLASQEIGNPRTKEPFQRTSRWRDHSDLQPPRAKRGRGFQADETGPYHDRTACHACGGLDPLAVGPCSQGKHRRTIRARHVQAGRLRPGCQKQGSERK
jgi:hypothetical protein